MRAVPQVSELSHGCRRWPRRPWRRINVDATLEPTEVLAGGVYHHYSHQCLSLLFPSCRRPPPPRLATSTESPPGVLRGTCICTLTFSSGHTTVRAAAAASQPAKKFCVALSTTGWDCAIALEAGGSGGRRWGAVWRNLQGGGGASLSLCWQSHHMPDTKHQTSSSPMAAAYGGPSVRGGGQIRGAKVACYKLVACQVQNRTKKAPGRKLGWQANSSAAKLACMGNLRHRKRFHCEFASGALLKRNRGK